MDLPFGSLTTAVCSSLCTICGPVHEGDMVLILSFVMLNINLCFRFLELFIISLPDLYQHSRLADPYIVFLFREEGGLTQN